MWSNVCGFNNSVEITRHFRVENPEIVVQHKYNFQLNKNILYPSLTVNLKLKRIFNPKFNHKSRIQEGINKATSLVAVDHKNPLKTRATNKCVVNSLQIEVNKICH